ncbi:hypothetical protein WG66_001650 [Moniliophthora roreri]|nr:hypothetical protein WG66_001650 [Moniliophthora roreri]
MMLPPRAHDAHLVSPPLSGFIAKVLGGICVRGRPVRGTERVWTSTKDEERGFEALKKQELSRRILERERLEYQISETSTEYGLSEDWNVYGHWFQVNFYDVMDMHSCSRSENPPSF